MLLHQAAPVAFALRVVQSKSIHLPGAGAQQPRGRLFVNFEVCTASDCFTPRHQPQQEPNAVQMPVTAMHLLCLAVVQRWSVGVEAAVTGTLFVLHPGQNGRLMASFVCENGLKYPLGHQVLAEKWEAFTEAERVTVFGGVLKEGLYLFVVRL